MSQDLSILGIMILKKIPVLYLPEVVYVEMFFDATAPFANLYFLYLLRRPFFHVNLRILLAHFSIGQILLTTTKLLLLINVFWVYLPELADQLITYIHNIFLYSMTNVSVLICCERLLASVLAARYEKLKGAWLAVLASATMWIANAFLTYFCHLNLRAEVKTRPGTFTSSKENDFVLILLTCVMIVNVVGVTMFLLIRRSNETSWKTDLAKKLSHRYQIKENLRTARQLLIVLCAAFALSLLFYSTMTYTLVSLDRGFVPRLLMQILNLTFAIMANLLPCLFIKTHPRLWATAKRHLFWKCKPTNCRVVQPLIADETNVYFNQLQSSWNSIQK